MEEIWKDMPNYEGLYQISNLGNVKSLNYNRTGEERVLKPVKVTKGYLKVKLCKNGEVKQYIIHRLVAETFIPNTSNKEQVNHINGGQ